MMTSTLWKAEINVGNGENVGRQYFLPFPTSCSTLSQSFTVLSATFDILFANDFN